MGGGGTPAAVDLLILGKGWCADYLLKELEKPGSSSFTSSSSSTSSSATGVTVSTSSSSTSKRISYAATTRDGRDGTIPFNFKPEGGDDDEEEYRRLPDAAIVLITFPFRGEEQPRGLVKMYEKTRHGAATSITTNSVSASASSSSSMAVASVSSASSLATSTSTHKQPTKYILLGATTTWSRPGLTVPSSPWDTSNPRAQAEASLLELKGTLACIPCLSGLYDNTSRQPRNWARGGRLARTKDQLRAKGAVHFVHGRDVGRSLAVMVKAALEDGKTWNQVLGGKRWIVTDLRCYDWWDLLAGWDEVAREGDQERGVKAEERVEYARWVGELMREDDVAVIPRDWEKLGRVLDGRDFWEALGIWPVAGTVS